MNMKKIIFMILCLILIILTMFTVNAGFFDGFFSDNNEKIETKFLDVGTVDNYSKDWYDVALTIKRDSVGTIISNNNHSDEKAYHFVNKPDTSAKTFKDALDWKPPFTVEFDIISTNNANNFIQLYDESNEIIKTFKQIHLVNGSHVKIVSDDSSVKFIVDNHDPVVSDKV